MYTHANSMFPCLKRWTSPKLIWVKAPMNTLCLFLKMSQNEMSQNEKKILCCMSHISHVSMATNSIWNVIEEVHFANVQLLYSSNAMNLCIQKPCCVFEFTKRFWPYCTLSIMDLFYNPLFVFTLGIDCLPFIKTHLSFTLTRRDRNLHFFFLKETNNTEA